MQNKWVSELEDLARIKERIHLFNTMDIAELKDASPGRYILHIFHKLKAISDRIKENIDPYQQHDADLEEIGKIIKTCANDLKLLTGAIKKAERTAATICSQFQSATQHTIESHCPARQFTDNGGAKAHDATQSHFLNIKIAGAHVWNSIQTRITAFESLGVIPTLSSQQTGHNHLLHNSLIHLLRSTDKELLDAIDNGQLALEGEIGNLIIQRLKEIYRTYRNAPVSPHSSAILHPYARSAAIIINRSMGTDSGEGLFRCDFDELHIEVMKLALHAELHPNDKTVWLGTARSVCALADAKTEVGIYLNCDDAKWTWHLNRLWLQAALSLGFKLELIEQHYPSVEDALLSEDGGARFVHELLKQVREDKKDTSQYNGYNAPTATAQEILVALDTRCTLRKGRNNRIYLMKAAVLDDTLHSKKNARSSNPLYNSWEGGFRAPSSPLKGAGIQFFAPGESSAQLRKEKSRTDFSFMDNEIHSTTQSVTIPASTTIEVNI